MTASRRIWEIDFLRGIAIVLMVLFHLVVDLTEFYGYPLDYMSGFWYYEGKVSAVLFIFLAGVSTRLSDRVLRYGLIIAGWGMVITLVTYWYIPAAYVCFGILHLIGTGLVLCYYLRSLASRWTLLLALVLLMGGIFAERVITDRGWLFPLGIVPAGFTSLDYYPLLPWGGVLLLGAWAGGRVYKYPISILGKEPKPNYLTRIGRHSLWIYLLHQPVLLALLGLFLKTAQFFKIA